MQAVEANLSVIDFETTGAVPGYPNEPWQIGIVTLRGGRLDVADGLDSLLYIGRRPFNPYAPGRHAELRNQLAAAPRLADLWPRIAPFLQRDALVAHNTATERHCLGRAFPLHGATPWIDTLALLRIAFPELPSHQLGDTLILLGLKEKTDDLCPGRQAHDAFYDAVGSAVLLEFLLRLPGWEEIDLPTLIHAKASPRRAKSAAFATRSSRADDEDTSHRELCR